MSGLTVVFIDAPTQVDHTVHSWLRVFVSVTVSATASSTTAMFIRPRARPAMAVVAAGRRRFLRGTVGVLVWRWEISVNERGIGLGGSGA